MSFKEPLIEYDSKNNLLFVKTQNEEPSAEVIMHLFDKVAKMCEINKCDKVLLDGTFAKKLPSKVDLFSVGEYMTSDMSILSKLRIAYVIPDKIAKSFNFFDVMFTNRGGPIHTFNNLKDAQEWLLSE